MSVAGEPCRQTAPPPRPKALAVTVAVWILLLAAGWWSLTAYGFKTESAGGTAPTEWPTDSRLPRTDGRKLLLVFLHPKCPCSHATVTELERLLNPGRGIERRALDLCIVACAPTASDATWTETRLIQRAAQLPRARVVVDAGGGEAARFAAAVSGTVMLFDPAGVRRYAGGVTAARGHEGDNAGRDALARILAGEPGSTAAIPALGCRLVRGEEGAETAVEGTADAVCHREENSLKQVIGKLSRGGTP